MIKTSIPITDIDGNSYSTVISGDQVWMSENLKAKTFRDGSSIFFAANKKDWESAGLNAQPACCFYDDNPENGNIYGMLYNWWAVHDVRGLAPQGWRIPDETDWMKLAESAGGIELCGASLKGSQNWNAPPVGNGDSTGTAIPSIGFNAIPSGSRGINGFFGGMGTSAYWWKYMPDAPVVNWGFTVVYNSTALGSIGSFKRFGFAVRCIKE